MVDALGIPKVDAVAAPKARHVIKPEDLAPKLGEGCEQLGQRFWYWFGLMPDCPVEMIGAAGVTFQKVQEQLIPGSDRNGGRTQRIPIIGGIAQFDIIQMRRLLQALPRIILRMQEVEAEHEELLDGRSTGLNVGDANRQPRRGRLITLPGGKRPPRVPYVQHQNDVAATGYMFVQLCADQRNGSRGTVYPDPLSETGLEWPGDEPLQ